MDKLGEFLGWATAVCFIAAVINYAVKRINKKWISPLSSQSEVKKYYGILMKFIVKNHKYFGIAAALIVAIHLTVQIIWQFPSVTGIIDAALLIITAVMEIIMLYAHKSKLITVHRCFALAGIIMFLVHIILKK